MQISQSNNQTSFGINSVKFSEVADGVFKCRTSGVKSKVMSKVLAEISQIKPKNGPDVDILVKGWDPESSALFLTTKVNGKELIEGLKGPMFYSGKKVGTQKIKGMVHKPFTLFYGSKEEKIKKAPLDYLVDSFRNLVNQVDATRADKTVEQHTIAKIIDKYGLLK